MAETAGEDPYERLRYSSPEERRAAARVRVVFGPPYLRWVVAGLGLLMWCVGAGLVIGAVRRGSAPNLFDSVWLAVLVAVSIWLPLRGCVRVELEADSLRWRTLLRSGRVPLTDVIRLSPLLGGAGTQQLLRIRSGPTLLVLTRHGFRELAGELAERAPAADVIVPGQGWRSS